MSTFEEFVAAVEARTGRQGRRQGGEVRLLCPAHDDTHPSLDVREGDDGRPLTQCRSHGCTFEAIEEAIGWERRPNGADEPEAVYTYVDESGKPLIEVGRFAGKRFVQRRAGAPRWKGGIRGVRRVLYRLPLVLSAIERGHPVWIAEGEKDVHALEGAGVVATCNPMGAKKWRAPYTKSLTGASEVVIVADRDDEGREHAREVAASLDGTAGAVRIVEAAEGKDAADHLAAGLGLDDFRPVVYAPSDVSGGRSRRRSPCRLEDVHAAFDELLLMPDHGAINIALAGVVANYATGDPVWPLLVGPPGCGKSEIVAALSRAPDVWRLSSLTPQTLLSGFEATRDGKPASLLLELGEFGIVAFKDLTTVLTMHREARAEIIAQLREVADGQISKSFGNGLRIKWEGKVGLVAGVTPIIDEQHAFLAVMGERFVLYRMPAITRAELARVSLARRGREEQLRERIVDRVAGFLERFHGCGRVDVPASFTEPLVELTDIVTRARSAVPRDGYSRDLLYLPEPEAPTRLAKQLAQLTAALIAIGVGAAETWALIRKTGWDSVPAVRCAVLDCLADQRGPVPIATIEEQTDLPNRTVLRVVEDIVALKLARRQKVAGKWHVEATAIAHGYWAGERPPETSDPPHTARATPEKDA